MLNTEVQELPEQRVIGGAGAAQSPAEEASKPDLTSRQLQILALIARGRSNKEIAALLGISERTVKFHVAALFKKLGAFSRTEVVVIALKYGLIQLHDVSI